MPAAELVDTVEVVRRDDEAVELAQVTLVCVRQAVHAVIVHCVLTPHTPEGGAEGHTPIRNTRKYTQKRGAGLSLTLTSDL